MRQASLLGVLTANCSLRELDFARSLGSLRKQKVQLVRTHTWKPVFIVGLGISPWRQWTRGTRLYW